MNETNAKPYKLKEVCIRLSEGHPLYSDVPLSTPLDAMDVMKKELSQYDREVVCVVNLNSKLKPINFNIVSIGSINASVAPIPNILKSGILSNAAGFILIHNHPSGDVTPSNEDISLTRRCIEAGKLMDIPCMDHVIVEGNGPGLFSFRESGMVDFTDNRISMTAEQIMGVSENIALYNGDTTGKGAKEMTEERNMIQQTEGTKREEITIKFGKGLAEPFTAKDGKEYMKISIPNQDRSDKTPWASFVLPAKSVHENRYGKGLWAKLPADGNTTVSKPTLQGYDDKGRNLWQEEKSQIPNRELKELVEFYKTKIPQMMETEEPKPRGSACEELDKLAKDMKGKSMGNKMKAFSRKKEKEPIL